MDTNQNMEFNAKESVIKPCNGSESLIWWLVKSLIMDEDVN